MTERQLDDLLRALCPPKFFSNRSAHLRSLAKIQIEEWMQEQYEAGRRDALRGEE